jgi:hypothetical protein
MCTVIGKALGKQQALGKYWPSSNYYYHPSSLLNSWIGLYCSYKQTTNLSGPSQEKFVSYSQSMFALLQESAAH